MKKSPLCDPESKPLLNGGTETEAQLNTSSHCGKAHWNAAKPARLGVRKQLRRGRGLLYGLTSEAHTSCVRVDLSKHLASPFPLPPFRPPVPPCDAPCEYELGCEL